MKRSIIPILVASTLVAPTALFAGAKINISDDSNIELGFRLQGLYLMNDDDLKPDNSNEFRTRRARLRLKGNVTDLFTMFLQTEVSNDDANAGLDMKVIDSYVEVKPSKLAHILLGQHMVPGSRQNLTSSGALMTIDRPAMGPKTLGWGTRAGVAFQTATAPLTSAGLTGDVQVRDQGMTLFGSSSLGNSTHYKYYLGMYEGANNSVTDTDRIAARVQLNFFDAEPGYFNLSTYLGKKKTLGIGLSIDQQGDVARDSVTGEVVDYEWSSVDVFTDWPMGGGTLTAELALNKLDLGGVDNILEDGAATALSTSVTGNMAQGDGYFLQLGYYKSQWQPWVMYENWSSDDAANQGSFNNMRVGVTYFHKGHNANIKLGYEKYSPDQAGGAEIDTIALGFYMTY